MTVTIGADPELFVQEESGEIVPMCAYLKGTKEAPTPLTATGYAVQYDNVMLEYNVPPTEFPLSLPVGASPGTLFAGRIVRGAVMALRHAKKEAGRQLHYKVGSSEAVLSPKIFAEGGRGAATFGCSPEFDATQRGIRVDALGPEHAIWSVDGQEGYHKRYAGGHVHIGYDNPDKVPPHVVAQLCDLLVLPVTRPLGHEGGRLRHYGSPGRFRPTPYGIEYRSPSTNWVGETYRMCSGNGRSVFDSDVPPSKVGVLSRSPAMRVGYAASSVGHIVEAIPAEMLSVFYRAVGWHWYYSEIAHGEYPRSAPAFRAVEMGLRALRNEFGESATSALAWLTGRDARSDITPTTAPEIRDYLSQEYGLGKYAEEGDADVA